MTACGATSSTVRIIAVSQRVDEVAAYRERRDALDQRWAAFLGEAGFLPLILPNHPVAAAQLVNTVPVSGVLLTGGNDLVQWGGSAPERDETERWLLQWALEHDRPLIGVCRGMQLIQTFFGAQLTPVVGHVTARMTVVSAGVERQVNSYHRWGTSETPAALRAVACAPDGVVKAVSHRRARVQGIMWHPEREQPFDPVDLAWVRSTLAGDAAQEEEMTC